MIRAYCEVCGWSVEKRKFALDAVKECPECGAILSVESVEDYEVLTDDVEISIKGLDVDDIDDILQNMADDFGERLMELGDSITLKDLFKLLRRQ